MAMNAITKPYFFERRRSFMKEAMRGGLINNGKAMIIRMFMGLSRMISASSTPHSTRRRFKGFSLNFMLNQRKAAMAKKEKV